MTFCLINSLIFEFGFGLPIANKDGLDYRLLINICFLRLVGKFFSYAYCEINHYFYNKSSLFWTSLKIDYILTMSNTCWKFSNGYKTLWMQCLFCRTKCDETVKHIYIINSYKQCMTHSTYVITQTTLKLNKRILHLTGVYD